MRFSANQTRAGFPLSYGVFQQYYSTIPEFAGNRYIGVVGTIASGLGYLGAPVVMPLIQRKQQWLRPMIWIGCTLSKWHKKNPHLYK